MDKSIDSPYKAIELWECPPNYAGAAWPGYYVYLGRSRDSDFLTEFNFREGLQAIGGESGTVIIVREGHWAVGWVEWITIHKSNTQALKQADEIMCALSEYPILDDDRYSEQLWDAMLDQWKKWDLRERVEACQYANTNIFCARHDHIANDEIEQYLRSYVEE